MGQLGSTWRGGQLCPWQWCSMFASPVEIPTMRMVASVLYCPGSNLRASLAAISSANSKVSPGLSPINSLFKVGLDYPFPPNGIILQPVNIDADSVGGKDGSGSILPQQPRLRRRSAHRLQGCHQLSHWVPDTPELIQILRSHEIQAKI